MSWQDLPEIAHDEVKLSGALDVFYPHWGNAITLPNNATKESIRDIANSGVQKWKTTQKY